MKDTFWFQHDSNAQHDERILELRAEFGWEGYGIFWALVERMRDAQHYRVSMSTIGGLSAGMGILKPRLLAIIELCCAQNLFGLEEGGAFLFAPSLRRRMTTWDNKKAALSEGGKRGVEAREARKKDAKNKLASSQVEATLKPPLSHHGQNLSREDKSREDKKDDVAIGKDEVSKPAPNPARDAALATTDLDEEQHWSESPLTKPKAFQVICDRLGHEGIAYERYRKQALVAAEDANISRTIKQWGSWIGKFLVNQEKGGSLIKQSLTMPTVPTPQSEYPEPGKETPGQVIAIIGVPHDANMNRMKIDTFQNAYPTAIIHAIL